MVNTSEGRPPQHLTQMKLFNAIAAAAVIGASVFAVAPEAKANYWLDYAVQINRDIMNDLDRLEEDLDRMRPQTCSVRNLYFDTYSVDCW